MIKIYPNRKWRYGYPDNDGKKDCVESWVYRPVYRGRWNDESCDKTNRLICSAPTGQSEKCPEGWSYMDNSDSCYQVMPVSAGWQEADIKCKFVVNILGFETDKYEV